MKSKIASLLLLGLGLAHSAFAIPYNLTSATATTVSGNYVSTFYQVDGAGVEKAGTTAIDLFSSTVGGDDVNGFWVNISFGGNPQPHLDAAFLKASNAYLWWDAADLAAFNAGTFDSIILWNNTVEGIRNGNGKFKGTSHAGLVGELTPVVVTHNVPDAGATVSLLGLGMMGLFLAARRRAAK